MSDEALIACADLETVRQLRAALDVAMQENDAHHECERVLRAELEKARAVVEAARAVLDAPLFEYRAPLVKAIADYEWAVQGVSTE